MIVALTAVAMIAEPAVAQQKKQNIPEGGGGGTGLPTRGQTQFQNNIQNKTNDALKSSGIGKQDRPECNRQGGQKPANCP